MSAHENTQRELTNALNNALGENVRIYANAENVAVDVRGLLEREGTEFRVGGIRFNAESVDTIGRGPNGGEIITLAF